MNFQPIDLPLLLRSATWPVFAVVALVVLRQPLADMVKALGQRTHKLSFMEFSLELTEISEKKPATLETEIRQLEAGLNPQSGSTSLSSLFNQIQHGEQHDYIVIDLGSESSPRWLTSRLYLLALLITLLNRPMCLVFVETAGGMRKRFVGLASPDQVRWALARRYGWLELAKAEAFKVLNNFPFDEAPPLLSDDQLNMIVQLFLSNVRLLPAGILPGDPEWVDLGRGMSEHAKWLDGGRVERLLGNDLSGSCVVLLPNKTVNGLADAVLGQSGRFVAVVDLDRTFRGLVDRSSVLESLARQFVKEAEKTKGVNPN
jgi:hypothetical protein